MGYVRAKALLGGPDKRKEVEFLVDTGAWYTMLPPDLAGEMGIKPVIEAEVIVADKRKVKAGLSIAYLKILDREGGLPVAIMDTPEPLLGATALEGLGIKVDPATGQLEYSRSYGLAVI